MAFTWNSTNGGTCYLKSSNGPLVSKTDSYASIMVQGKRDIISVHLCTQQSEEKGMTKQGVL